MTNYNLKDALHHIAWVSHCFRGSCTLYESNEQEFTAVCDFPESQLTPRGPEAVKPFLAECRQRILTSAPDAIVEVRDYQQPMITSGPPGSAPQHIHRVFLTVRETK
jgi:hypothetical protein